MRHEALVAQLARWLIEGDASAFKQDDPVGVLEGESDVVHGEDLGLVPLGQGPQDIAGLHAVEGRHWLVAKYYYCPIIRGERRPLRITLAEWRTLAKSDSACTTVVMARSG